jgi:hypothetical protein
LQNLRNSLRFSNLIGRGMPERIRSVGFAFLGLTAAAGLAVVAVFAQMGFPLLSPSPLPDGPSEPSSVSKAVPVRQGSATADPLTRSRVAAAAPGVSGGPGRNGAGRGDRIARIDGSAAPISDAPDGSEPITTSPPTTAPTPPPEPTPTTVTTTGSTPPPDGVPVSSPGTDAKPDGSAAVDPEFDESEARPAAVKPSKPSKAKPAKTKPAKESKPEATPAPAASYVPSPAPASAAQGKEEKGKEEKKDK